MPNIHRFQVLILFRYRHNILIAPGAKQNNFFSKDDLSTCCR